MNTEATLPPDTIREKTQARYEFNPEETGLLGKSLANTTRETNRLEDELNSIKQDFKTKLAKVELEKSSLCRKITDGYEMREAFALVTFNDPSKGRKTYRHEDNGEFIREEAMTQADSQLPMFINADGQDATLTENDDPLGGEPFLNEEPTAEDIAGATADPVTTPVGDALDQAASLTETKLLTLDLAKYEVEGALLTAFKKAARAADWTEPQISLLATQLKAVDSVKRMKEVLAPHCEHSAE